MVSVLTAWMQHGSRTQWHGVKWCSTSQCIQISGTWTETVITPCMFLQNQLCKGHNLIITWQPCDYHDAQTDGNPGPQTATSYRITPGVHTVLSLSIYTDPLTSIWLAKNLQQMLVWNKTSLLGHKQLTIISMPEHKLWCHSVIMYHLLSMCHVHIKVRIKFSASEGLMSSFFNSLLIMLHSFFQCFTVHFSIQ